MPKTPALTKAQLEDRIVDYFLNVWEEDPSPEETLTEKFNGDKSLASHVLKTWLNTPNYAYLTRAEIGDVTLRRWVKACLTGHDKAAGATAAPASAEARPASARERLAAVKTSLEGGEPKTFQRNPTQTAGTREIPQTTTPASEGRNMPANTQTPGAAEQGQSDRQNSNQSNRQGQEQKAAAGRLIYKEGDIAIFLNTRQGPSGPFHVYGIVDGPQNGPDTRHYSMPVKIDGFDIECSERTRGGDVMNLYRGEQVMLERRLENPIQTEDGVLTHLTRLVEVREEARGDFMNLQPYIAIPVFRRNADGQQEGRPIGYRIPAQDWTPKLGEQLKASGEKIPNILVWKKQGEKGGRNIYLSIPEAYDARDGRAISRDGVELSKVGVTDGVMQFAVKIDGRTVSNERGRAAGQAGQKPRQDRPAFAPGGRLGQSARSEVAAQDRGAAGPEAQQDQQDQTESQQQPAQRGSRRR